MADRPAARDPELTPLNFEPTEASPLPVGARPARPAREQPRSLETMTIALVWTSCGLALLSMIGAAVPAAHDISLGLALMGLLFALGSLGTSLPIDTLRHLRADITGGTVYDQMRGM